MELTCEGKVPNITINNVKYRILDWNDTIQELTVARDDYWSGICAVNTSDSTSLETILCHIETINYFLSNIESQLVQWILRCCPDMEIYAGG
jgi:hypothetical protein